MSGKTITVGTASAEPGSIARGVIPVTTLAGGTALDIPVVIVNGVNAGPVFWVNGAIHGDEPEGPLACQIALAEVDPAHLSGTLVMCPVVNVPAFEAAQRGNPADTFSYDMNRIYPGRENGYLSERVAAAHAAAMGPLADFEISIHSGGAHSFLDKSMFIDESPESVELGTAMGPGWGCIMSNFNPTGSPMAYLKKLGKVGITVELGGRSATSPEAFARIGRELANSILNILRHYKMYPGQAEYPSPRYKGQQEALLAPASGIFVPEPGVAFLTMMKKGDRIARIKSIFGDVLGEIVAPADGMFFGLRALPNVTTGDWCCFFCKVEGTRD
ncbi:succinylglutamate desuccinylase/aspartoacylase family protein [Pseudorhodobacter sp. MZDSW-24AT]|uniref:succinylglutamate desuccinylase/aspartoacylase family protein n=1 Tax=Pseudorhodobacter sp. MZDSW-24AT TaxID=2052957 RepID=UPI000C1E57BF|nr:M14 family metallopeptidase [Pseudorhodobacter sp. MZDSW-24AT]PJF08480.1 succinylglutamate desuccinylase [Pseudorhodobacter sp. MZDSW-24AT]